MPYLRIAQCITPLCAFVHWTVKMHHWKSNIALDCLKALWLFMCGRNTSFWSKREFHFKKKIQILYFNNWPFSLKHNNHAFDMTLYFQDFTWTSSLYLSRLSDGIGYQPHEKFILWCIVLIYQLVHAFVVACKCDA